MMRRHVVSVTLAAACMASATFAKPSDLSAQTLFATRGLGAPLSATDARAAGLGGVGTGLSGISMSLINPADISGLLRRGGSATMSPLWNTVDLGNGSEKIGGSRFPLLRVFYPVNVKLAASLAYGGYLDQTWGVQVDGREILGTDTVKTSDVITSVGGVSQLRLGLAYAVSRKLAVGVSGGMMTGSLDRAVLRTFADSVFDPFESRLRWSYRAPQGAVGLRFDPVEGARIGASVAFTGKLKANAEDSVAENRQYGSAMQMNVGASALVAPALMVVAGVTRDKYPEMTAASAVTPTGLSAGASTRDTWTYGGGLEYTGLRSGTRTFPFRLGYRMQQLPYAGAEEEAPKESALTIGSGYNLATEAGTPQALIDISIERASRTGLTGAVAPNGLKENFWRMNFTLSLFGR